MDTSEWENKETNRLRANRKKLQELDKKIDKTKNASNTSIYQHKMIICDIRQKLKKTDKASARRKEHINFDIKKNERG